MLQTKLATSRLLARPGGDRLWVLDVSAAALWDLHTAGWAPEPLAALLGARFGLDLDAAHTYLDDLHTQWHAAGLLAADVASDRRRAPAPLFAPLPPPVAGPPPPGAWPLGVADRALSLEVADDRLCACLEPLLAPVKAWAAVPAAVGDRLVLRGDAAHWTLTGNGAVLATGHGQDAALVATLHALTELGCRTGERLLVVHGAGLVAPDGRALLLIAPGGSGKSTLTAALEAAGFGLLSDDVVPVTPTGDLVGLGLPLCLKPGSWPVLAGCRPDLAQAPVVQRLGQAVRLLPPCGRPVTGTPAPALLLFPRYRPGRAPRCEPLSPERALQGLIEAEAVIRDLTQAKLAALALWVSAAPAYALTYPDLECAMRLVRERLHAHDPHA